MATAPLVFGRGLGRSAGELAASPEAGRDIRNLLIEQASVRLRDGLETTGWPAFPWGTDTLCIHPFRRTKDWLAVRYDRATREMRVYKVNPATPSVQLVGNWITLNAACAPLPPVILAAEHSGLLFFAHAERNVAIRAHTVYYTPDPVDTNPGTLTALTADLDLSGVAEQLKFAGVYAWGAFLCGWGFGNATFPDEPAMVRLSFPGDALDWPDGSFVILGSETDPVIAMASADDESLPVFAKRDELYTLLGSSPADFEPKLIDAHHGVAAPRLILGWEGKVWLWDAAGPRLTDGQSASVDIEMGLGLLDEAPPDLGLLADLHTWGFMVADEQRNAVYVLFPDAATPLESTTGFALSMESEPPGWSYLQFPRGLLCAQRGPIDKAPPPPVTGYASAMSVVDGGPIGLGGIYRRGTVSWTNNSYLGDESLEVFVKVDGVWSLATTVPVTGASQSVNLDTLGALTAGTVAIRMARGAVVMAGYGGSDPDAWSGGTVAGARAAYTMGCATPVLGTPVWSRTSSSAHQHALAWTLGAIGVEFEVYTSPDGAAWSLYATLPAAGDPRNTAVALSVAEAGTTRYYRIRAKRGAAFSSYSGAVNQWAGPSATAPVISGIYQRHESGGIPRLIVFVQPPTGGMTLDLEELNAALAWTAVFTAQLTIWAQEWLSKKNTFAATAVRARFRRVTFGVADFSPYTAPATITTASVAPITPVGAGGSFNGNFTYTPTQTNHLINLSTAGNLVIAYRGLGGAMVLGNRVGGVNQLEVSPGHEIRPNDPPGIAPLWEPVESFLEFERVTTHLSLATQIDYPKVPFFYATYFASPFVTQTTPGIGSVAVKVAHAVFGGTCDFAQVWWRDSSGVFNLWQTGCTITPAGTTGTINGLPLGVPLQFRVSGNKLGLWNTSSDFSLTLV